MKREKKPIEIEEREKKKKKVESKAEKMDEVFADPTYDITFKMLFANEKHKDILISLLNSLLGFEGHKQKEIIEVVINSNELPVSKFSEIKGESGVESTVDILCTNRGKQKIAIEMQRQKTKYFLAREQEYMSKLISNQVKEGQGKQYHEKVLETYIIIIGKSNIFVGNTKLKDQTLFEIDVVPMVVQTKEIVPSNKMHWKFFELPKFIKSDTYKNISKMDSMKNQWLEFLADCSKQKEKPDRSEIIKKGYEIMKIAKWTEDQKLLYWKQKRNEQDFIDTIEIEKQEAEQKAKEEGKKEGKKEGINEGIIKTTIDRIKDYFKFGQTEEQIKSVFKNFSDEQIIYIGQHLDASGEQICNDLDLLGKNDTEFGS